MKYAFILSLAGFFLFACKPKTEVTVENPQSGTFACPMKCEGEKTYPVAGKCPVCGMDLVSVSGEASMAKFEINLISTPDIIESGKPVSLAFTPRIAGNATTQVPLDEVHDHKIHVIVVSKDLGWYQHIHPEYQADGSYTIQQTFPWGGEYIVFSDFQPTGEGNQVHRSEIVVNGNSKSKEVFSVESLTDETNGYTVTLKSEGGKFLTNNLNHLGVDITEGGKEVTDLEPVMGALGHMVIISADGQNYLHVHPEVVDGKLDLHTQFEKTGFHRAFFQFQTNGKLHTSYFTLDVKEGKAGEMQTSDDHHHHEGDDHSHDDDHQHN